MDKGAVTVNYGYVELRPYLSVIDGKIVGCYSAITFNKYGNIVRHTEGKTGLTASFK